MQKKLFSIRVFHWFYALAFFIAYISADDNTLWLHVLCAAWVFQLALFRLLMFGLYKIDWHIINFELRSSKLKEYLKNYFAYEGDKNPASSFMSIWLIFLGVVTPISGYVSDISPLLAELHEIVAKIFVISVLLHIAGVIADGIFHKDKAYLKMIDRSTQMKTAEYFIIASLVAILLSGVYIQNSIDLSNYEDVETEFGKDHDKDEDHD